MWLSYYNDPQKVYGMTFASRDVHFRVADGVLTVIDAVLAENDAS